MSQPNVFDTLKERGFVQQVTDGALAHQLLGAGPVVYYSGFDPTADSLHVGHLLPLMVMAHLQRAGHHPIALVGGGTALVGDPTGKTESRPILALDAVEANKRSVAKQLGRIVDLNAEGARIVDNSEWLLSVTLIDFLREIGRHFTVSRMLAAETYRNRLETGLSFLEFNYQILQAYDYLMLHRRFGCALQLGGDDQWSNILAGVDLIRRTDGKEVIGLTSPLLVTASGEKMGKTAAGALWLDPNKTSPYDFYQYWINIADADVERFLALFTFLPMEEVRRLGSREGADLRSAKAILAYEVTKLVHGEGEAEDARAASRAAFGNVDASNLDLLPTTDLPSSRIAEGITLVELIVETGLRPSRNEARRLIQGGGFRMNDDRVDDIERVMQVSDFPVGSAVLRAGKKQFHRVRLVSETRD